MSESLSGTNFETKDKRSCGRHTWQWLVEGQTLGPGLAWLRISSHLLSKSFRYLQPYYPPSNFLVFSPNRPPQLPPPMEWGSNNQERTYVLIKQNDVCFKFQKLLWRKLKILSTLTSFFFLSKLFTHTHIYTRIHFCCSKVMLWHWICAPLGNGP